MGNSFFDCMIITDGRNTCKASDLGTKRDPFKSSQRELSHIERTEAEVYATGNKWVIENYEATHK